MKLMREIQEAKEYSAVIVRLLATREEQYEITVDRVWEDEVNKNETLLIVCGIPMPPPIQALQWERVYLCDELQGVFKSEEQVNRVFVRFITVQHYIADWLMQELRKRPDVCQYLHKREYHFGVGARWRMLIIEELPKQVEGNAQTGP